MRLLIEQKRDVERRLALGDRDIFYSMHDRLRTLLETLNAEIERRRPHAP
jgi:hypothetical protein